ncbi:MAG: secondary thiamine-phosphate synthase enzyme YjbQ [Chthoniobacterales bacterium]
MKTYTESIVVKTQGKGTYEITDEVAEIVRRSKVGEGIATIFIQHTSASLIIYENADPSARVDLARYFEELVPEETPYFVHTAEGLDDTTSHIRSVLTRSSETIPIAESRMQLGAWQGIFVFEHRRASHQRCIVVSIVGA